MINTNKELYQEKIPETKKGLLFVLSGPCGAGKTSLATMWHKRNANNLYYTKSVTTRRARIHEEQYDFVNKNTFLQMIENDEFVQWIHPSYDEFYGTLKKPIEEALSLGMDMVFDYCPEGYLNLKKSYPNNVVGIFVMADSLYTLEQRLLGRGTETDEEMVIRYDMALKDFNFVAEHEYHIVNHNLEKSLVILDSIRAAEKNKVKNQNIIPFYNARARKALLRYYVNN